MEGMKWLQGTYTQRFNSRHKLWGHLLQGRYKAIPVDECASGNYFSTIANYIHLNPARSKAFDHTKEKLNGYRWSSYPLYLDEAKRPAWLVVDRVLGSLGVEDSEGGQLWYQEHIQKRVMEIALGENPQEMDAAWGEIRRGWYFGSDDFRKELMIRLDDRLKGSRLASFSGGAIREHNEAAAESLIEQGLNKLGVARQALGLMRKGAPEKMVLVWLLKNRTVAKNEWISQHLFCGHPANIPGYVKKSQNATDGRLEELKNT